ncbi:Pyroglutamylated RFamide peptide receptor [Cricetulus griseus]|uniref:Pyroglutamylated RFamide peptide receptor n=1 Tax=Cricetulus griseus TaxID=10029 RepID=G3I5A6_CRIGR|nr:Pyroglutamylated RFamide peptide receptor [Cricetulus griseus]
MRALNITAEQFSRLLSAHNLTREQFIHRYGLRPLVYTPELPARAKLAFALAGALIFALALFGNSLVVYVVTRSKAMRTVTNIFICSLALSDLLIAFFCIPVTMLQNISDKWLGGARQELQGKAAGMEASPEPSAMKAEPSPEKSQALQALQKELGQIAKLLKQNDPLDPVKNAHEHVCVLLQKWVEDGDNNLQKQKPCSRPVRERGGD